MGKKKKTANPTGGEPSLADLAGGLADAMSAMNAEVGLTGAMKESADASLAALRGLSPVLKIGHDPRLGGVVTTWTARPEKEKAAFEAVTSLTRTHQGTTWLDDSRAHEGYVPSYFIDLRRALPDLVAAGLKKLALVPHEVFFWSWDEVAQRPKDDDMVEDWTIPGLALAAFKSPDLARRWLASG